MNTEHIFNKSKHIISSSKIDTDRKILHYRSMKNQFGASYLTAVKDIIEHVLGNYYFQHDDLSLPLFYEFYKDNIINTYSFARRIYDTEPQNIINFFQKENPKFDYCIIPDLLLINRMNLNDEDFDNSFLKHFAKHIDISITNNDNTFLDKDRFNENNTLINHKTNIMFLHKIIENQITNEIFIDYIEKITNQQHLDPNNRYVFFKLLYTQCKQIDKGNHLKYVFNQDFIGKKIDDDEMKENFLKIYPNIQNNNLKLTTLFFIKKDNNLFLEEFAKIENNTIPSTQNLIEYFYQEERYEVINKFFNKTQIDYNKILSLSFQAQTDRYEQMHFKNLLDYIVHNHKLPEYMIELIVDVYPEKTIDIFAIQEKFILNTNLENNLNNDKKASIYKI